jgi:DNA invertase Pin-like site-specific DNA recombinase
VAGEHVYRDVGVSGKTSTNSRKGWHTLDRRLARGDTLVIASIDRIGRTRLNIMSSIRDLVERGVKIRSLASTEAEWARYLDADLGSPEALLADVLASFCAWNAQKEVEDISRRTVAGLNRARAEGKKLGAPRALNDDQVDSMRELHLHGKSKRWLSKTFGVGRATVDRYLVRDEPLANHDPGLNCARTV